MKNFRPSGPSRRKLLLALMALSAGVSALLAPRPGLAQGKGEIRIAHIHSKTGPLEA